MLYFCVRKVNLKLVRVAGSEPIPEKILVFFPGALGDFICFLPALEKLATATEVDLYARTEYAGLPPAPVRVYSLERYEVSRLFVPGAEREERLQRFFGPYSRIYSWMGSGQQDFVKHVQMLAGGKLSIFPFRPSGSRIHMVDYFLSCVGIEAPREMLPDILIRPGALAWRRWFWRRSGLEGKRVLVLSPGSGAREKNWPIGSYMAVAEWWEKKFDGQSVVVLGPVEEEREQNGNCWGNARVVRGLELAKLAALISRCDLYLGNDSGVSHLAAAVGVKTVALFGPTDPLQWAPRGRRVTVVTQNVECSPCLPQVMKLCPHRKCLNALSPDSVIHRLEELLKMTNRSGSLLDKVGCRD